MDRTIVLSVLGAALMGFIGLWLLLSIIPDERAGLHLYPWDVSLDEAGYPRVFGLDIGRSTLADARELLGEEGKVNLFVNPDASHTVEVYFNNLYLSNLRADWILTLDLDPTRLASLYDRGLRVSTTGSGSRKVELLPKDIEGLADAPIRILTYLPWKRLSARDIAGNFGSPAERRTEDGGIVHWLYPDKGMDIARDADGAVVIQYLSPEDFKRAIAPLAPATDADRAAAERPTNAAAQTGSGLDPEAALEVRQIDLRNGQGDLLVQLQVLRSAHLGLQRQRGYQNRCFPLAQLHDDAVAAPAVVPA